MTPNQPESIPQVSCRCGQGANKKKRCNDNCQCINCCNPHGRHINISQLTAQIRSRKHRHHQSTTLSVSGKSYSEQKAEKTTVVHWTLFEACVNGANTSSHGQRPAGTGTKYQAMFEYKKTTTGGASGASGASCSSKFDPKICFAVAFLHRVHVFENSFQTFCSIFVLLLNSRFYKTLIHSRTFLL